MRYRKSFCQKQNALADGGVFYPHSSQNAYLYKAAYEWKHQLFFKHFALSVADSTTNRVASA